VITKLTHVSIWVKDQEEARRFYVDKLGFRVHTDDSTTIPGYRWLTVAPPQQSELEIVLGAAFQPEQVEAIGKQGTWVLASDDIYADYERLRAAGVKVRGEVKVNPYGTDFVFEDLYGNTFDLVLSRGG
jgi:catechol 2,3-dioxygenase-like lactoylglutathione lyase family enzyme